MIKDFPPNIAKIRLAFPLMKGYLFAYGNEIYNPDDMPVDPAQIAHEAVHSVQQGDNPEAWWDRYLFDPVFRCSQEVLAYQKQYQFAKKITKDRERLNKYLHALARDLSGEMYGSILTHSEAIQAIKSKKIVLFNTHDVI